MISTSKSLHDGKCFLATTATKLNPICQKQNLFLLIHDFYFSILKKTLRLFVYLLKKLIFFKLLNKIYTCCWTSYWTIFQFKIDYMLLTIRWTTRGNLNTSRSFVIIKHIKRKLYIHVFHNRFIFLHSRLW